jgi:tRNA (cmo5U34)-methyltransferase
MTEKRFSWLAGQEYDLWAKAVPHYEQMQEQLARYLALFLSWDERKWSIYDSCKELWCGTGYTTKKIIENLKYLNNNSTNLYAIDNEDIMLQQAEMNLETVISPWRVCLVKADILQYLQWIESQSSRSIASAMTIHNLDVSYRSKVLEKIYDWLVRWWLFINADKYALDNSYEHQASLWRQLEQFQKVAREENNPAFLKERTDHYLRDNELDLLMKQQEAIDEMKRIWFKDIQIIFREQMEAILVARK